CVSDRRDCSGAVLITASHKTAAAQLFYLFVARADCDLSHRCPYRRAASVQVRPATANWPDPDPNRGLGTFPKDPNRRAAIFEEGAPGRIRTHDPQIRSLVLYPAELPVRSGPPNLVTREPIGKRGNFGRREPAVPSCCRRIAGFHRLLRHQ